MIALAALHARSALMAVNGESPSTSGCFPSDSVLQALTEALNLLEQGVLLVDEAARVHFASTAARAVLAGGRLQLSNGVLRTRSAAETIALHRLIARCARRELGVGARDDDLSASCRVGEPPLSLLVAPLPIRSARHRADGAPTTIVFITDPAKVGAPSARHLRDQFGLTTAEAAFALEIIQGQGLRITARRLKISEPTARTHLQRIFEKTGTRRQAELVRLIFAARHAVRQSPPE
jgi:DNA-binding CsgD family transcriptional regulator